MNAHARSSQTGAGPSDAALVVAARAGERWAQEALFRRYTRMVNGLAYRLLGRDDDLDDLVQDAFLSALRSLDRLENPAAFGSWLGSIVVRTAHKKLRHRSMLSRFGLRPGQGADPDLALSRAAPPEVVAELSSLYRALDCFPADVRVAITLHRVEGMNVSQVAEHMGVSVSTVKRRLADGQRRLTRLRAAEDKA
ncbi:MAG: sigma-70 family RNA polymerase sigma factor [Myxococcales bacterium]|nr:sigma-70 family RNA polymerase sigma factor [Myxococcales bacterium]